MFVKSIADFFVPIELNLWFAESSHCILRHIDDIVSADKNEKIEGLSVMFNFQYVMMKLRGGYDLCL